MLRLAALVVGLGCAAAAAQEQEMDRCSAKCTDGMGTCLEKCSSNMKCANGCNARMTDCLTRCQAPNKAVTTGGKDKKCFGADGKRVQCGDYKPIKAPKPGPEDPAEQYPNKAAKDLQKDPNFKAAEGLQ